MTRYLTSRARPTIGAWLAGAVLTLLVAALVWGVAIEPRLILDRRDEMAAIPDLPDAWVGARIAVIADLQIGMWLGNEGMVRRIVARIVAERPAAVLIAGDFVYAPTEDDAEEVREEYEPAEARDELAEVERLLRPMTEARIPTYAVLGNHDYGMETREAAKLPWLGRHVRAMLSGLGIRVLHNEAVALAGAGVADDAAPLYIVGIGPLLAREADPVSALAQVPPDAPRLVLMHHPDVFGRLPAGTAPLAISGHTHGGQVRLPFTPHWTWVSLVRPGEVHGDGWIPDYGAEGNRLYVNRGIGFSRLPLRINCPPELTIFTLERAPPRGTRQSLERGR